MKKFKPTLVVDLNSLHDRKGDVRRLKTYLELGDLKVVECSHCQGHEVFYNSLPYGVVQNGHRQINTIKFQYETSPRGAHSFLLYPLHIRRNTAFPNSYVGWGCYPDQAFIQLTTWVWADELLNVEFYALRNYNTENLNEIGQLSAGNAGGWIIVSNKPFGKQYTTWETKEFDNINYDYAHPSCLKKEQEQTEEQVEEQAG